MKNQRYSFDCISLNSWLPLILLMLEWKLYEAAKEKKIRARGPEPEQENASVKKNAGGIWKENFGKGSSYPLHQGKEATVGLIGEGLQKFASEN